MDEAMKVLVTGGTGHLGTEIVRGLQEQGHAVRVLARGPRDIPGIDWVVGDLATGQGVAEAVAGVDVVVHAATHSPAAQRGRFRPWDFFSSPADVDVDGTRALLAAAGEDGAIEHFLHVSIVGLQHMRRLPYSRRKLEAEALVKGSPVPWSIVRATGFYWLMERLFAHMAGQRFLALPSETRMAPVDSDEFAEFILDCVNDGPQGDREDFAGPQTLAVPEMMRRYLEAHGEERRIHRAPVPRKVQAALTAGNTAPGARRGTVTWAQWLQKADGASPEGT
jgi:uncharacterized protein YbjT (DUF2867 family)